MVSAIGGSAELLELLHHLTIADAEATGPAAWSDWKAALVGQLVRATGAVLGGGRLAAAAAAVARRCWSWPAGVPPR